MDTLKIAYVEDKVETRLYLGVILLRFETDYKIDYIEYNCAKDFLNGSKFDEDILFVDFYMPDMNGDRLLKECLNRYEKLPKIVMATASSVWDFSKQFNDFIKQYDVQILRKPFLKEEISKILKKHCSGVNNLKAIQTIDL